MNILHIMKDYKPSTGGSVVRNSSMIDSYKKKFDDKLIIVNMDGEKYDAHSVENGVDVYRCKSLIGMLKVVLRIIKKEKIDIVHTHNFRFLYVGFLSRILSRRKVKLLVELHAIYSMSKLKEALSKYMLKRIESIIVLAESAKTYLVSNLSFAPEKIVVIRNGISDEKSSGKYSDLLQKVERWKENYCVAAYMGSFIDWQGVIFLAKNADFILENLPNLFLVMIGDGPDYEKVENILADSRLRERVLLSHGISKSEIASVMKAVDIVLIPRQKNLCTNTAIPLKVIEAMQEGKCIVSADDNGLTELLNIENARLFESENARELLKSMEDVVIDKALRDKLGEKAKLDSMRILKTWDENADCLRGLYYRL